MRVAIVGSRQTSPEMLEQLLRAIPPECSEIVSGGAQGADQLAREAAKRLFVPLTEFLPEYDKFGRAAPVRRNQEIAEYCDLLIAVWDGESAGTRDVLIRALRLRRPVKVLMDGQQDTAPPAPLEQTGQNEKGR